MKPTVRNMMAWYLVLSFVSIFFAGQLGSWAGREHCRAVEFKQERETR